MGKVTNMMGKSYGRLTVTGYAGIAGKQGSRKAMWECLCECGNEATIRGNDLRRGKTLSCGCFGSEKRLEASTSHGMRHTPTYNMWCSMKARCTSPHNKDFRQYGGRGIKICARWLKFKNFYEDMGERPHGVTIERIDNNRGYSPGNCCYATRKAQMRNTRRTRIIRYQGKTQCLRDWAEELNINRGTLWSRLKSHPPEIAFNM